MLSSLPVFMPELRALRVLCSVLFSQAPFCFLFFGFNRYLCHGAVDVRTALLIYLFSFSIYIFTILIPVGMYLNMTTHFLPLILIPMFFFAFFFFRNSIDTCVTVSIDVIIPLLIS